MFEIANMSFEEFAENIKATCAANKFPSVGAGCEDVYSYSVYLNGPLADKLPENIREMHVKDVWLTAKTAEVGLNPELFRDNTRVLELVATREAYMTAVLAINHNPDVSLSEQATEDYRILTSNKLTHPYLVQQIEEQKRMSTDLKPAIESASAITGKVISDRSPREISKGTIVSQSNDFTFQELMGGEIAVHENRRLDNVPEIGNDVTIAYYHGHGQVYLSQERIKASAPYIDPKTQDLAVRLINDKGETQKVILFNSFSSYAKFVGAHDLDDSLIESAMNLKSQQDKKEPVFKTPVKTPVSDVYVDSKSGCIALDYKENGAVYSVLFSNVTSIQNQAKDFGMNADHVGKAKSLDIKSRPVTQEVLDKSIDELVGQLKNVGVKKMADPAKDGQISSGKVLAESSLHLAQDVGRGEVQIFDKRKLDKLPGKGDTFTVKISGEVGKVSSLVRDNNRSISR
jgi:hypothetical protein